MGEMTMHRSSRAILLAVGCAAIATLTAQPADAGPFDRLKKIAETVERKTAEAEEVRQRAESIQRNVDSVADAIGIKDRRQDKGDGTIENPAAEPCAERRACEFHGKEVSYTRAQQQPDNDGWPGMEPTQEMEGTPQ